jgi:hypothetical protein
MIKPDLSEGMSGSKEDRHACQLKHIYEGTNEIFTKLTLLDRARIFLLQQRCEMQGRIEKRLGFLWKKRSFNQELAGRWAATGPRPGDEPLKAGDLVRVLPIKEIEITLDSKHRTQGLWFMPGMKHYCGMKTKVMRKVRYFFDERAWGMIRCRNNVYILEDALCTGEGMFEKEGCDRCCFFFWHGTWLQKL